MNIIMLGKPGSGKGTIGKVIAERLSLKHLATGDLFRSYVKNTGELGERIKSYMSKGDLVPDELTIQLVEKRLEEEDCQNGVVFDGFPRTIIQAEALNQFLTKRNNKIDIVLELDSEDEEIIERTINRRMCTNHDCGAIYNTIFTPPKQEGICDKCGAKLIKREDDTEETVKDRIATYYETTQPLIDFYEKEGILYKTFVSLHQGRDATVIEKEVIEHIKQENFI